MQLLLSNFENHTPTSRNTHKNTVNMENWQVHCKPSLQRAITRFRLSSVFRGFTESCTLQINTATSIYFQRKLSYEQNLTSLPTQAVLLEVRMSLILIRVFVHVLGKLTKSWKSKPFNVALDGSLPQLMKATVFEDASLIAGIQDICKVFVLMEVLGFVSNSTEHNLLNEFTSHKYYTMYSTEMRILQTEIHT